MTGARDRTTLSRLGRGAAIVAVWCVAAFAILGCALTAYLGSVAWGDGQGKTLGAGEAVGLLAVAVASAALALWLTRRLSR